MTQSDVSHVPVASQAARPTGWLALLNGPQTMGRGPAFWTGFILVTAAAAIYPLFVDPWTVGHTAYFFTWVFMALGLCLLWGYAGALSRSEGHQYELQSLMRISYSVF